MESLKIGGIEIMAVWDGTLDAELGSVLRLDSAEARDLVERDAATTGIDPLVLPVRAFLLRRDSRLVLVDTGSGKTKGPSMGHLPASLAALGIEAGDIDSVLLTHMHMDHVGGLLDDDGAPAFANAELVLHAEEARWFLDTPEARLDARSRRNLAFQRRAVAAYGSRVRRVRDGEGLAGVTAELSPGHTPGHTCWHVGDGGESALIIGDVVHLAAVQLPRPDSAMIYDVDADRAVATRQAVLAQLASSGMVVAGMHLPGAGLGRIARAGEAYSFVPAA